MAIRCLLWTCMADAFCGKPISQGRVLPNRWNRMNIWIEVRLAGYFELRVSVGVVVHLESRSNPGAYGWRICQQDASFLQNIPSALVTRGPVGGLKEPCSTFSHWL